MRATPAGSADASGGLRLLAVVIAALSSGCATCSERECFECSITDEWAHARQAEQGAAGEVAVTDEVVAPPSEVMDAEAGVRHCFGVARRSFIAEIVERFDMADEDDAGYRTELTVRHAGKTHRFATDFGVEVQPGSRYTFFVDDGDDGVPLLVEIRQGSHSLWHQDGAMGLDATLGFNGTVLEATTAHGKHTFAATPGIRAALGETPSGRYVLDVAYEDGGDGYCETLRSIGRVDPANPVQVDDPREGPYTVPGVSVLWRGDPDAPPR